MPTTDPTRECPSTKGLHVKLWLTIALVLLAVVVALQNAATVELRLLFWRVPLSLILVVLLPLGIGFLTGFGLGRFRSRKPGAGS